MSQLILKNIFQSYTREQFLETAQRLQKKAEAIEGGQASRVIFRAHRSSLIAPEACHPDALDAALEVDRKSRILVTDNPSDLTEEIWGHAAHISFSVFFNNSKHRNDMSWGELEHDKNKWKRAAIVTTRFDEDLQQITF